MIEQTMWRVLECSTAGDEEFSALHARVEVFGVVNTIEHHYQMAKRFAIKKHQYDYSGKHLLDEDGERIFHFEYSIPENWRQVKGKTPDKVRVGKYLLEPRFLTQWYKLLWMKYLDSRPDLVEYASGFNEFTDKFRGKSINCQADVVRQYVKQGRASLVEDCSELLTLLRIQQEEEKDKEEAINVLREITRKANSLKGTV